MNIIQFVQDKLGVTTKREERLRRRVFDYETYDGLHDDCPLDTPHTHPGMTTASDARPRAKMHPSNRPPRKWWGR